MKVLKLLIILFFVADCYAQMAYNNCNNALELCPNTTVNVTNIGANRTLCGGCEDDFNFCFAPANSIWIKFTTNAGGGDVQISLTNPVFQIQPGQGTRYNANLIQATIPCNSTSYTSIGNCISAATGSQAINTIGLAPNTTYYLVLSGDQTAPGVTAPAEFNIDVAVSGTAVDRPIPVMNAGMSTIVCKGSLTPVYAERVNCDSPGPFRWYINNELVAVTTNDSTFYTSALQNGDIIRVESDCFATCTEITSVSLPPATVVDIIADAGTDVTIRPGETIQLNGTAGINSTVFWTPSYALSDQSSRFPIANPNLTTTYSLLVTDTISGCTAMDYVTVTVDKGLFFPTTFSPNGDGENETWVILGIEAYPDCLLNIYNRWGQQVFQSTGYNKEKAWDGRGKAGQLNEGVYFYELQLRDPEKQILKGSITLIH